MFLKISMRVKGFNILSLLSLVLALPRPDSMINARNEISLLISNVLLLYNIGRSYKLITFEIIYKCSFSISFLCINKIIAVCCSSLLDCLDDMWPDVFTEVLSLLIHMLSW